MLQQEGKREKEKQGPANSVDHNFQYIMMTIFVFFVM